jgi:Na+(H+)/acetate symporter ActP
LDRHGHLLRFVLGIGFALKRYMKTSTDFFLSGRSIPAWITGPAFISANLGAQEVIGMSSCRSITARGRVLCQIMTPPTTAKSFQPNQNSS